MHICSTFNEIGAFQVILDPYDRFLRYAFGACGLDHVSEGLPPTTAVREPVRLAVSTMLQVFSKAIILQ